MNLKKILVAFDLREDSFSALQHAAFIARQFGAEILVLHLVKSEDAIEIARHRMEVFLDKLAGLYNGPITPIVKTGNIFQDISENAAQLGADLIIVPTHGIKGMQHLRGSNALRVVTESDIPFLIVQERLIREHGYKKIVIPVEDRKQILNEAPLFAQLSKVFQSEVHLFSNTHQDQKNTESNLSALEQYFEREGANVTVHTVNEKQPFAQSVAHFAASLDADLICTINYSYEYLYTLFPRVDEEYLIYNEAQIPVLMITPEQQDDFLYAFPILY
ncbi:MAG: hypothetical protein RLZZ543_2224 [Bacteroidota bacterium]|jgi:nucleotide-binding universal stress UspA family protein